ncbi:alpha-1A adrenergic receptor-like [Haliotis cracherodii]|uniref:alpha-1A adrenergic receptor-like n=1 Tax=Haliotis cracherodii TaxID=6455 RepID=UPI0039EB970C
MPLNASLISDIYSSTVSTLFVVIILLIAVIGTAGNITAISSIINAKKTRHPLYIILVNFNTADLIVSCLVIPVNAVIIISDGSIATESICYLILYCNITTVACSATSLSFVALYRLTQICYPNMFDRVRKPGYVASACLSAWVPALVVCAVFGGNVKFDPYALSCRFTGDHLNTVLLVVIYVPVCVSIFMSYIKIYVHTRGSRRKVEAGNVVTLERDHNRSTSTASHEVNKDTNELDRPKENVKAVGSAELCSIPKEKVKAVGSAELCSIPKEKAKATGSSECCSIPKEKVKATGSAESCSIPKEKIKATGSAELCLIPKGEAKATRSIKSSPIPKEKIKKDRKVIRLIVFIFLEVTLLYVLPGILIEIGQVYEGESFYGLLMLFAFVLRDIRPLGSLVLYFFTNSELRGSMLSSLTWCMCTKPRGDNLARRNTAPPDGRLSTKGSCQGKRQASSSGIPKSNVKHDISSEAGVTVNSDSHI